MTSAFELFAEPCIGNLYNGLEWNEACRHYKHVGIIVLLDEFSDLQQRPARMP